jgi:hypothetical protein
MGKKTETIFPKVRNESRTTTLPTLNQHSSGTPSQSNKPRRRNKRHTNRKRNKVSLFVDDMLISQRPQKLLDSINSFSSVAGYKINLQNSVTFLYTNNEQVEKEYMKTIPFTTVSKKIKYLGVNLTKDLNKSYKKNFKPLKKEIKEDYKRWKALPCSWIG